MQGYFFAAATLIYAALKWRYILPKIFENLNDVLAADYKKLLAPFTAIIVAITSCAIVLLHDDGFFTPSSDPTKMAYITLAIAAIAIWIPDNLGHTLTLNTALIFLAAYNLKSFPVPWWWFVLALNSFLYIFNLIKNHLE